MIDLCSKKTIKKILKNSHLSPSKRLGQNFLIDKVVLQKILTHANLQPQETILEVGAGVGTLTFNLAKKVKKVIAIEKDQRLCQILRETLKNLKNVEILQGDILKLLNSQLQLKARDYKVVANLPFYLTAPVIRKFLESPSPPKEMILTVQKEVAQRICAKPPKINLLALSIQFYATPKIINYISKKSFWPSPKVDSALIKLKTKKKFKNENAKRIFFLLVKAGFSHPRKKLINNLSQTLGVEKKKILKWLKNAKLKEDIRAESLGLEDWFSLVNFFLKDL